VGLLNPKDNPLSALLLIQSCRGCFQVPALCERDTVGHSVEGIALPFLMYFLGSVESAFFIALIIAYDAS
jgi:hypothetical protein